VYGPVVEPDKPGTPPTLEGGESANEVKAGSTTAKITWAQQSCPAGQTLSGYALTVTGQGAINVQADQTPGGSRTATFTAGADGTSFQATLQYFCGQVNSPQSDPLTVTVVPATP
jgi:eukaryotic-like serine/threonine-protein kinase